MTVWPLPRRRWDRLAEAGGWGLSGTAVTVALAGTLMWAELQAGSTRGLDRAILLELDPLPPVAALPAPPPAAPASAPPPPDAPATDNLPDLPDPTPASQVAAAAPPPATIQADAPPSPADPAPPAPVAADPALAEARPRARPDRAQPVQAAESLPAARPSAETASAQPQSSAQSRAGAQDARAQWGAAIRKKVERRKAYPKAARGARGEVVVKMTVNRSGVLEAVAVARSSGNAALDEAALTAVRRTGGFPAAPDQLTEDRQVFSLPMQFAP